MRTEQQETTGRGLLNSPRILLLRELNKTGAYPDLVTPTTFLFSPHVLINFRGFPPGCGDSVADF